MSRYAHGDNTTAAETTAISSMHELLAYAKQQGASDVHLTEGLPPKMRVNGCLRPLAVSAVCQQHEWLYRSLTELIPRIQYEDLAHTDELDCSIAVAGIARLRVNIFRVLGSLAVAMRFIPDQMRPLKELGMPPVVTTLATEPNGLVLVTGPTGSGKSTTLAAMVDLVNRTLPKHIVTIEDPVEFRHRSQMSLIHQREIGSDTRSFAEAMRRVLRQDPDVILIGELRDPESIATALTAAETGHLVLATLHTQSAAKSIHRIIDAFLPGQQTQVRAQLGDALRGIVSQILLPRIGAPARVAATEILVNTPAIANLIREGEVSQIYSMLQAGRELGMHTLDQDLKRLVTQGTISLHAAQSCAHDPQTFFDQARQRDAFVDDLWVPAGDVHQAQQRWQQ